MKIPANCEEAPACIDYRSYIFLVSQSLSSNAYNRMKHQILDLGKLRHEMLGVSYVDMEWGLAVIPQQGFPEIKINFFHHMKDCYIENVLQEIAQLLEGNKKDN